MCLANPNQTEIKMPITCRHTPTLRENRAPFMRQERTRWSWQPNSRNRSLANDLLDFCDNLFNRHLKERRQQRGTSDWLARVMLRDGISSYHRMGKGKHQFIKPKESDLTLEICMRESAVPTSAYFNLDNILFGENGWI